MQFMSALSILYNIYNVLCNMNAYSLKVNLAHQIWIEDGPEYDLYCTVVLLSVYSKQAGTSRYSLRHLFSPLVNLSCHTHISGSEFFCKSVRCFLEIILRGSPVGLPVLLHSITRLTRFDDKTFSITEKSRWTQLDSTFTI